jgi:hypothetical protein
MNLDNLQHKLILSARAHPPDDSVPYAFEQRIMARLTEVRCDLWSMWSALLWRAVAPCLGVMVLAVLVGVFSLTFDSAMGDGEGVANDLDSTVLAAVDNPGDAW